MNNKLNSTAIVFPNEREQSKSRIVNTYTAISLTILLFSALNSYYLNDINSFYTLNTFAAIMSLSLVFSYLKLYDLAKSHMLIIVAVIIFYFSSYSGLHSGVYLFYFPVALAIVNIFDFSNKKEKVLIWMHLGINMTLILINNVTNYDLFASDALMTEAVQHLFKTNLMISILCIGYFTYLIVQMNLSQKKLIDKLTCEMGKSKLSEETKQSNTEILLAELQHRLKNNLSLMSSLIRLKVDKVNPENVQSKINEVSHAIQVVADANRFVIFNEHCLNVPVLIYFNEVIESWKLIKANENKMAKFNLNVIDYEINIKQAIPLALIIHELMVILCNLEEKNHQEHYLNINLTTKGVFSINSSIENLLETVEKQEHLIKVLIDQIDAELVLLNNNEFEIRYNSEQDLKKIESEAIFE